MFNTTPIVRSEITIKVISLSSDFLKKTETTATKTNCNPIIELIIAGLEFEYDRAMYLNIIKPVLNKAAIKKTR